MSINDEEFFTENIVKINDKIKIILYSTAVVPVLFAILTVVGIWIVPHTYSLLIFVYCITVGTVQHILNKRRKTQIMAMYFGIFAVTGFVSLLGYKGIIIITLSYAFPSFISCLYYNRKLTFITSISSFLAMLIIWIFRSATVVNVTAGLTTRSAWLIANIPGIVIEFTFVCIVADFMAHRTDMSLQQIFKMRNQLRSSLDDLQKRNDYIIKINNEIEEKNLVLHDTQFKIIEFVSQCLGSHDLFTGRHVIHTKKYVEVICRELREEGYYRDILTDENIELYSAAAFLHDIGKIHIPEGVLNKVGKFTTEEFALMKSHPEEGKKLLEFLPIIDDGMFNKIAIEMAYGHHEKWDGSGYPQGIKEMNIPLSARIMAAADVLDALISQRLYKDPMSVKEAIEVFRQSSGLHFEPCIAQAVINSEALISIIDSDFKANESTTNEQELNWWLRYHSNIKKS